jgi:hypothetical protein
MPTSSQVSLTERKRQIVAEADRHRAAIELEFRRVTDRVDDAQALVRRSKGWLWGGGLAVASLLLLPKVKSTLGVLAAIPGVLRGLRR